MAHKWCTPWPYESPNGQLGGLNGRDRLRSLGDALMSVSEHGKCAPSGSRRARTIHLALDNLNIHHVASLVSAFSLRDSHRLWRRLTVHYTPRHGSWVN